MPRHRRRRGPSRFLLPATLGGIVLAGLGSLVPGTVFPPTPAGAVDAATGTPVVVRPTVVGPSVVGPPVVAALPSALPATSALPVPSALPIPPAVSIPPALPVPPALPAPHAAPAAELSDYQWPLPNGRITLPFGPSAWGSRVVDGEPFHDGLDLATFCGDRIVAAHSGVVLAAGRRYDTTLGWIGDLTPYLDRLEAKSLWSTLPIVVVVDDGNGYRSIYAHLSKSAVKKGDTISAGDLLGYEGMTGRASGCHLHYGLFSPLETARFGIDPEVVERMKLPAWQIARIDPLLVLPERRKAIPAGGTVTPMDDAPTVPTE